MIVILTPAEIASIEAAHVVSKEPLILRSLPAKENGKSICSNSWRINSNRIAVITKRKSIAS
jgi:hypothetical protein